MNHLLYLRVHTDHPLVEIRMISHQNIRIPRARHEDRIHSAANRRHEDLAHLQSDQECKRHDNGREGAALVVCRLREFQIEKGQKGAQVGDEGGAHGEDGADETVIDEGVDAAVLHHPTQKYYQNLAPLNDTPETKGRETYVHVSLAAGM